MKKRIIVMTAIAAVIAGFTVFFAMQATPRNVLTIARAEALEIKDGVITVPESYTVIEAEAFAGKADFNKIIVMGEADIGESAFYGCGNLRSVVLEKDCDIKSKAFADCPCLESVSANSGGGSCAFDAFDGHGGVVIYCREGSQIMDVAKQGDISYRVIE